jgi:hypothetical protein
MFVAGLVDGIIRKIDETRRRHHQHHGGPHGGSRDGETYQSFVARQEEVWTPPDLFDKCCARWLAGGGGCQHHYHNHGGPPHRHDNRDDRSHTSLSSTSFDTLLSSQTSGSSLSSSSSFPTTTTTMSASLDYSHRRLKNGQWTCNGGCNKLHPTVTLFFDTVQQKTLAVLSCRLDPFVKYFDSLVDKGCAVCKTPYLYELDGYVRQNLYYLTETTATTKNDKDDDDDDDKEQQRQNRTIAVFGSHLVKVALGAMEQSDQAHRDMLESQHLCRHRHRHNCCQPQLCSNEKTHSTKLLDDVLDVCLLNGLADDLDVLTLHCLQRTNRKLREISSSIIKKRLAQTQLVVSPLVDGCYVAGYSVFRRSHAGRTTVMEREHGGRMVEYAVCPPILCKMSTHHRGTAQCNAHHTFSQSNVILDGDGDDDGDENDDSASRVEPQPTEKIDICSSQTDHSLNQLRFCPSESTNDRFDWACEELSFANLEREWGDICVHEYIGQNIVVYWRRSKVDIIHHRENMTGTATTSSSSSNPVHTSSSSLLPCDVPIFNVRLGTSKKGPIRINEFSMPHFTLKLDVEQMNATQVDEVTVRFGGKARIVDCQMDYLCLVAMYARSLEPVLFSQLCEIKKTRPLLQHEQDFFSYVQKAAALCCAR